MPKVLLVNPPRVNLVRTRIGKNINIDLTEISSFPPMGLMYLGQALRSRRSDANIRIIDAIMEKMPSSEIAVRASQFKPDVIGITAHTYNFYDVLDTATKLKSALPDTPIVIGGSHMYIFAEETMTHKVFDYGVRGDGENVFADICEAVIDGRQPVPQEGLFMWRGGRVEGDGVAIVKDLDEIKSPAIDLIEPHRYYNTIGKRKAVGTICTSRGCPFRCTFCQVPKVPYRMRSAENVLGEIREYIKIGIDDFFIFDDLFNINKERIVNFCNEVLKSGLKIGFMFRGRVDQIDDEMLSLAKKAGCHTISMGIEDATDDGLKAISKNIRISQAYEAVKSIRRHGMRSSTNWIIGFPHHRTKEDLMNLFRTAIKVDSDYAQFGVLHCLPGSEIYDQAVAEGGIDPNAWRNYVLNPTHDFELPIWEKHFTKKELYDFYEYCYKGYYIRPKFILRELFYIDSFSALKHKMEGFITVFLYKGSRMKKDR